MMRGLVLAGCTALLVLSLGSGCCCVGVQSCGDGLPSDCHGCDTACDSGCDGCGPSQARLGGPGDYYCWSPLRSLADCLTCKSGCGEVYCDEWIDEPPADCDSCDQHGNWTGHPTCFPNFACLKQLCGCSYDGCCEDCNHQQTWYHDSGEVIHDEVITEPVPQSMDQRKPTDAPPKPPVDDSAGRQRRRRAKDQVIRTQYDGRKRSR